MKVLHIECNPEVSVIYSDILKNEDYDFESTVDGKIGLEMALKNNYNVILLDLCLPHYTGFDFLVDLKIIAPTEIKKVAIVTSLELERHQTQFLMNLGVHSINKKPISVQRLISKMVAQKPMIIQF